VCAFAKETVFTIIGDLADGMRENVAVCFRLFPCCR
jgi:hypothetical protein